MFEWNKKEEKKLKESGFKWLRGGTAEKAGSGGFSLGEYNKIMIFKRRDGYKLIVNRTCAEREKRIENLMEKEFKDLDSALNSYDKYDTN